MSIEITFLGTGAATSSPLIFCRCEACETARITKGKDFRKRSSLLINDDLLIDLGPDVMSASFMHDVDISKVRYWLQTHSHSDHFDSGHLITRIAEYATENPAPLKLYASHACIDHMSLSLSAQETDATLLNAEWKNKLNIDVNQMQHGDILNCDQYEVIALESLHDLNDGSLLFAIKDKRSSVFYGTDTVKLCEKVWDCFKTHSMQFDVVILDHTYGPDINGGGHLNANQFVETIERMRSLNLLKPTSKIFATHISHEGNPIHEKLEQYACRYGYDVAYDGLVIQT